MQIILVSQVDNMTTGLGGWVYGYYTEITNENEQKSKDTCSVAWHLDNTNLFQKAKTK